jgi:NADPH:quinone reductase-like Zn-dependent oxidoreductase
MREAAALAEVGKLEPRVDPSEYLLSEVAAAHDTVESVTAAGKVAITLS